MSISGFGTVRPDWGSQPARKASVASDQQNQQAQTLPVGGVDCALSDDAQVRLQQMPLATDKVDALIASWFKHLSPANTEDDRRRTAQEDHEKRVARAQGRSWSDPGHVADPVKEPSQKTIVAATRIIAADGIMQTMDQLRHDRDA